MICSVCGIQYAPFPGVDVPGTDFFQDKDGIHPTSDESGKRREAVFSSDEFGNCGDHIEGYDRHPDVFRP